MHLIISPGKQQGFTLIETMIALVLLVIGIMSVYTMQISSLNGNAKANRIVTATAVAADSYERLLNVPYNDPTMDPALNHTNAEFPADFSLPAGVTGVNWAIVEWTNGDGVDNDGDGVTDEGDEIDIKAVTLSINYTDRTVPRTMTVNFYKSKAF